MHGLKSSTKLTTIFWSGSKRRVGSGATQRMNEPYANFVGQQVRNKREFVKLPDYQITQLLNFLTPSSTR
jgi:hypothetical protein